MHLRAATSFSLVCLLASPVVAQAASPGQKPALRKLRAQSVLPAAPLVGGSDACTTPDVIVGLGNFMFDTTTASTGAEGQSEPLCNQFATTTIALDVWFTWTAPFTGQLDVATCNLAGGNDTKIAVYAGNGCPTAGSALACNDDACGYESVVSVGVTSGSTYVIQIGEYPFGAFGLTGSFSLSQSVPPVVPANDDCSTPSVISGPGPFPFDNRLATTGAQGQNQAACGFSNIGNDQWYTWTASMGGSATLSTCTGIAPTSPDTDTKVAIYDGNGCPVASAIACNDDDFSCFTSLESSVTWNAVCGQTYTIQLGRYPFAGGSHGTFSVVEGSTSCGPAGMPYCFGDGSGTACPCGNNGVAGNGCASTVSASGANLATSGIGSLSNDTLVLHGTLMPNSSCLYFQGVTQVGIVFGDGVRCVGGSITRLGTKSNAAGASQYPSGSDAPISVKGGVLAPATRTYQVWYRNAAPFCTPSTFNLSNGVLVMWQ